MAFKVFACFFLTLALIISGTTALVVVTTNSASNRSGFGEFCNSTSKCYKGAWLNCQNGICGCFRSEEMMYDSAKQKCVSKAGERCKFELNSDLNLVEQTDCVPHGICGSDGICGCEQFFYETYNGTCLAQGGIIHECNADQACRTDRFLQCIEGLCNCNMSVSHFHFGLDKPNAVCVGLGSKSCLGGLCTSNAICTNSKICQCSPTDDFFQNSEGRCEKKKELGGFCEKDSDCKKKDLFLDCVNGTCDCNPLTSKYEETTYTDKEDYQVDVTREHYPYDGHRRQKIYETRQKDVTRKRHECVGRAEQLCNPNLKCIENSQCKSRPTSVLSMCECNSDYSPTSKGLCGYGYGKPCDKTKTCSDTFICSEGTCKCKNPLSQIYSEKSPISISKCLSKVSGFCTEDTDCVPNSICQTTMGMRFGRCQCSDQGFLKYVRNFNGECDLAHGSSCEYKTSNGKAIPCDSLAKLQCRNAVCSCPDMSMVFDDSRRQCLQLVGSRCSEGTCLENATCVQKHPIEKREALSGECQCLEGFEVTVDSKCEMVPTSFESVNITSITSDVLESPDSETTKNVNFTIPDPSESYHQTNSNEDKENEYGIGNQFIIDALSEEEI